MNSERLLDGYNSERRAIGERVAKTSLYNMSAPALVLDQALGLAPEKSEQDNVHAMLDYFDLTNRDSGEAKRRRAESSLDTLDVEFYAHGAEVGWFYDLDYDAEYGYNGIRDRNPQINDNGEMELTWKPIATCLAYQQQRRKANLDHGAAAERQADTACQVLTLETSAACTSSGGSCGRQRWRTSRRRWDMEPRLC